MDRQGGMKKARTEAGTASPLTTENIDSFGQLVVLGEALEVFLAKSPSTIENKVLHLGALQSFPSSLR